MVSEPEQQVAARIYRQGIALHREGRIASAEEAYRLTLAIEPAASGSLQLLGVAHYQQGRPAEAAQLIGRAVALDAGIAEFHNNLAAALLDLGDHDAVAVAARRAIVLKPDLGDAYVNLGAALRENGGVAAASPVQQRALAVQATPSALNDFSVTLRLDGRHEAALRYCRAALACAPDNEKAYYNLALILMDLGQAEARLQIARSLAVRPSVHSLRTLTELVRIEEQDPWFDTLQAMDTEHLRPSDQIPLKFALAKGYGDLGERDRSFACLLEANRLKRAQIMYDEAYELDLLARIRATFSASLCARFFPDSDASDRPIFIVGLPRSGTTLVEQVLASHPAVAGAGELPFLFRVIDQVLTQRGLHYPESLVSPDGPALAASIGRAYLDATADLATGLSRFTDKLPGNLLNVGLIRAALPKAKIVLVRRDPVDVALSCFSKLFSSGLDYTYDLGELGRYIRASLDLMDHWEAVMPAGAMLTLSYEALVENFEPQARRLLDYCGLAWDERVLNFHRTERAVRTASVNQVRQPLYRSSVGKWRPDPSVLEPLLVALG